MHVITRSCVLFLWMHTLTFVKSQDCTREQFINGPLYDSNFDTSGLEASYSGGRQVRVGCNVGYSGFFKLICVEGKWVPTGKKCEPKSCGHPGDGQFSDFHLEKGDDFVFGSQVVYTCHKGYQMQSRTNYRRCMAEGWDGVVPVCEAQQCPVLKVANNVQVIGDPEEATFGNVVRFSCKSNTEILFGSTEIYCDENGEWSAEPPKCDVIKCTVPKIEHGYVPGNIQEYEEHDVLHFLCEYSYKRAEERPSKCTKLGIRAEWIPTPVCELITCRLPQRPPGTSYEPASRNVFSPGDTVRVICGEKYWISSPQNTLAEPECKDNGDWTITPVCREVICSNPRDPLVHYWGDYYRQQIKLDETVSYTCRRGYKTTDGVGRAKCTRDGWRPNPLCEEVTCDREDIQNADIFSDKQVYKYNEQATYVCKEGYQGHFTRTCGDNGWTWPSRCTEVTCNRRVIQNADIINDKQVYKYNEQATYVCKEGYQGRFTLTCTERGWTGPSQCTEVTCDRENIQNADIINDKQVYKYNEQADYVCKEGYRGRFTRTCGDNGWTGPSQCTEVTCDREDIQNADIVNDKQVYKYNDQADYVCKEGYQGRFTRTCKDNGWTGPSQCTATACPNVEVSRGFVVGPYSGMLYYSCNEGYKLFTKAWWGQVKCKDVMLSEHVQCIEQRQCGEMPLIPNMEVTHQPKVYQHGERAQIICKKGYQAEEDSLTCREGKWHPNGPLETICTPIASHCSPPRKVENAVIVTPYQKKYLSGSAVTYKCRDKYTMEGNDTIPCTDGKWDTNIICSPLSCDPPPADGGVIVEGLPENEEPILPDRFLKFSCDGPGKYLNGSSVLVCGKDGQWDSPFPSCKDITCELGVMHPHLHAAGLPPANETMKIGHRLQFQCDDEYSLDGSKEIHCLPTGQWNAPFPTCSFIGDKCKVTGVPNNVRITTQPPKALLREGEKLKFACRQRGDALRGSAEVECLANAQWSDPFPTCGPPLGCRRPPPLADGDTKESVRDQYRHNERVEYICQPYYIMEGEPYKTCNNGEWTGRMRCLKPCTVDTEAMSQHNIDFRYNVGNKLYSTHGDRIQFRCIRGRTHVGERKMIQYCVDGVILLPICH